MTRVGVLGAGVMGVGVAQNLAQVGHQVVLVDQDEQILDRARQQIQLNCRMSGLLGGAAVDSTQVLGAIRTQVDYAALADVAFVIENITERWELKQDAYQRLDAVCLPDCIFVVNTSTIPITQIASVTGRPSHVVGVHFMNPVPMKPAVELIPGRHTLPAVLDRTRQLLDTMGKKAIQVGDTPGFVSNRILMLTVNEAAFLVYENVASATTVDEVFRSCFGHPMGPLETADLIGLDTVLNSMEVLHESFSDSKYRPCPLLRKMVEAGLLGRKSQGGFYPYGRNSNGVSAHVSR